LKEVAFDWLIVNGAKAMVRGVATIHGGDQYDFQLKVVDGGLSGGEDGFRIMIWDADGSVIYDNQMGAPEDAEDVSVLGGGSVVIHGR
jgi:hypothetical protein